MIADTFNNDRDPFALARRGDAELFALLAEYKRREQSAEESGIDDDERARRCDHAREAQDKLDAIRPTTLRGVLALLDYHSSLEEDRFQPGCAAIEGLREIAAREGGQ